MNCRIPNGTYGGVGGRGLVTPSYSIAHHQLSGHRKTSRCRNTPGVQGAKHRGKAVWLSQNPFLLGPIFLKNKAQVEAMTFVFELALLIAVYLE